MGSLSEFMGRLYERSLFQGKDVGRFYAHSASLGLYHLRPPAVPSLQTGEDKLRAIHHAVEFGIFLVDWMKNWYMNHSEDFIPIDLRLPMALPFGKEFPKWHQGIESERKFKESDDLFGTLRQLRGWCPCTHDDCPREDQFPIPEMREIDWEGISNIYNNTAYRIAWQRAGGPECMDITCSVLSYRLGVKVKGKK